MGTRNTGDSGTRRWWFGGNDRGRGRAPGGLALVLALALAVVGVMMSPPSAGALTLTVNTTNDMDDGSCNPAHCSLREAINAANANAGMADLINFAIPGCGGACTIQLLTDLPPLIDSDTTIDGFSQAATGTIGSGEKPGAAEGNTCQLLFFQMPPVAIRGMKPLHTNAMTIGGAADNILIKGLAIYNTGGDPNGAAIGAEAGPGTNRVLDNVFVGLLPNGGDPGAAERNTDFGVRLFSGNLASTLEVRNALVGWNGKGGIDGERDFSTLTVTQSEVFQNGWGSAAHDGIDVNGVNGLVRCNVAHDNTNVTMVMPAGDSGNGIEVGSTSPGVHNNVIEYNTSRDNLSAGISIRKGISKNTIRKNVVFMNQIGMSVYTEGVETHRDLMSRNSTFQNFGLGIDLENMSTGLPWALNDDGSNMNDPCDGDLGANKKQNYPDLMSVSSTGPGGFTNIQGTLDSTPFHTFRVEFFATPTTDLFGPTDREGKIFIGDVIVTTDALCMAPINETFPVGFGDDHVITSTATDITTDVDAAPINDTSEYSLPVQVNLVFEGKVTGGGFIVPESNTVVCTGPCQPSSATRANFGFNAKFQPNDPVVPQGHTTFVAKGHKVHFVSTSYVFLFVDTTNPANQTARWQGSGKLNHDPNHCFKANVTDRGEPGTADSWRIKIWSKATSGGNCNSEGTPIYDNGSDAVETTLGGGNIQVHMKP